MSGIPNVTHAEPCTCAKCNAKANRVAVFGGIRRAVDLARTLDQLAHTHGVQPRSAFEMRLQASAIRHGIRAAIGSDKP